MNNPIKDLERLKEIKHLLECYKNCPNTYELNKDNLPNEEEINQIKEKYKDEVVGCDIEFYYKDIRYEAPHWCGSSVFIEDENEAEQLICPRCQAIKKIKEFEI